MSTVVLYGRAGCHLCDEARAMLAPILGERPDLELREVDIETDDRLLAAMLERIPVIELDGCVVSELVPDPQALRDALLHTAGR